MYHDTIICISKENKQSKILQQINKGIEQGCPLSPVLYIIYIDKVIQKRQTNLNQNIQTPTLKCNTV
jgi:hypothetical protein